MADHTMANRFLIDRTSVLPYNMLNVIFIVECQDGCFKCINSTVCENCGIMQYATSEGKCESKFKLYF